MENGGSTSAVSHGSRKTSSFLGHSAGTRGQGLLCAWTEGPWMFTEEKDAALKLRGVDFAAHD